MLENNKNSEAKPKIISLFSGAGGMDIGFEKAGFEVAVAVELDPTCCQTLRKNRPNTPVIEADISKLKTSEILKIAGLNVLETGLVIGGPPCQSFSLAGKRLGMNEPRGRLVLEFIRIVRESLPVAFVMENVKGMANWHKGEALNAIKEALKEPVLFEGVNYKYTIQHKILNAVNFGVPQHRERIFLVGNRVNKEFIFPKPTHGVVTNQAGLFNDTLKKYSTVSEAISGLPKADEPSNIAKRISETIESRMEKYGY
jgi:DNA (cytosine-5)-methyltransferase 1